MTYWPSAGIDDDALPLQSRRRGGGVETLDAGGGVGGLVLTDHATDEDANLKTK